MELVFVRYDDFVLLCSRNLCLLSACGARQKIIRARCDDEEKKMIYQRWKKAYYFLFRECRPWNDNILSIYSALPNNTFFNARGRNKRVYHIRARAPFFFFINYARARDTVYSRGNGVNDTLNEFRQRVYILRVYTHVYVIDGTKYIRLFLTFLRSPFFIHTRVAINLNAVYPRCYTCVPKNNSSALFYLKNIHRCAITTFSPFARLLHDVHRYYRGRKRSSRSLIAGALPLRHT